ncbi:hypothetical protein BTVI_64341 [Pitangus sulphuratus]|nr:hypothetical protein BTVI_64341 [Pitangus sulphuratus]
MPGKPLREYHPTGAKTTHEALQEITGTMKHDRDGERVMQAGGVHGYCPKEEKQDGDKAEDGCSCDQLAAREQLSSSPDSITCIDKNKTQLFKFRELVSCLAHGHIDMAEDFQEICTNLDWKPEGKYDTMKLI